MSDAPAASAVSYRREDDIAVIHLDDGKANALSYTVLADLDAALDRALKDEVKALVLAGRPGRFSAGFDLSVMRQGPREAMELAYAGADLAIRLFDFPAPVVLAVTGHALAMGAVLCLAADERIGAQGDFKVGLNEVAIGMVLPDFGIILAQERLSKRHLTQATASARIYTPVEAIDAGFLDRVVAPDAVVESAVAHARELAGQLAPAAHAGTKRALRAQTLDRLRQSLVDDRAKLGS